MGISAQECIDIRPCFAAVEHRGHRYCRILTETYKKSGQCRFCKKHEKEVKRKSVEND